MLSESIYIRNEITSCRFIIIIVFSTIFFSSAAFPQYANFESDSLLSLGNKVYRKGNYSDSERIYKKALDVHSSNKKSDAWIIAAVGYGASQMDQGKIRAGARWMFKADSAVSNETPLELQAYVKSNVGWATWWLRPNLGVKDAEIQYTLGLELAKKSGDEYRIAQISASLSSLTQYSGEFNKAINYAKLAVEKFTQINDEYLLSLSLVTLHRAYNDLGFIEKAEEAILASLQLDLKMGNKDLVAEDYKILGLFYQEKGDYDKALVFLSKHLDMVTITGNYALIVSTNDNIGSVYFELQEYERALEYFKRSEQLRKEYNFISKATIVSKIALTYQKLGQFEIAEDLFQQALASFIETDQALEIIATQLLIADLELLSKDLDAAKNIASSALENALRSDSKQLQAKSYTALSKINSVLGLEDIALKQARSAYNIASFFKGYSLATYSINLAKAYYETESDSAFFYSDLAFEEIEKAQNNIYGENLESGLFSKYAEFYDLVALWHLEKNDDIDKAFEITERGRSRVLLERLSFSEASLDKILDESTLLSIRQKEKNIDKIYRQIDRTTDKQELEYLNEELRGAEFEYVSFTNELRLKYPSLNSLSSASIVTIPELQSKLTDKDAIIEYMITPQQLVMFIISKNESSYKVFDIKSPSSTDSFLSDAVSSFRGAIQNQESMEIIASLSDPLVELLITPLMQKHPDTEQLVIIPTHSLSILPFDALYHQDAFLIERLNIKYLPSSSIYDFIKNPHRETKTDIMAIAGSGFNTEPSKESLETQERFASLPSTLLEVDAITSIFEKNTSLKNDQVTEAMIKSLPLDEYRYLHFATHGNVNEINPQQNGLLISKMNDFESSFGEDGYLNSLEISNLTLNADLVVLSACNTAIGKMVSGEGIFGLQRSFFQAGASSVMVSLWNVYDKSTSVLMGEFYTRLNQYEEDEIGLWTGIKTYLGLYDPPLFGYKERALRDSKLTLLDHPYYNHPVNWAPFIMIGK